ncbi:hypothetical protein ACP4OV_017804 [Aristida adscensionis]
METAQQRELHGRQAWWPLDTMAMACSLDSTSSFLFEWDPQLTELRYFGPGAEGAGACGRDDYQHELELVVPKLHGMESPVSEASAAGLSTEKDAAVMSGELDELLRNLWDSDEKDLFFSSSCALKETSTVSLQHDDHFTVLRSNEPSEVTLDEKTLPQPQADPDPSSSSSHCNAGPHASDTAGAQRQPARANCSTSKRPAQAPPERDEGSKKRSRTAPATAGAGAVARPFTAVKPGGADGAVTLADINAWILAPPARPIRHPVGEFACAPRVSAGNRPAPSGKTVAGFTRLHTAGRGTVTIVRTRG